MNRILILLLAFLVPALLSCSRGGQHRKNIIPEKKMVELLIDTHLADAILFVDNARPDEKRDKALYYYPSVLEKHGVTKAMMDSSVAWYMRHPSAYARVYSMVIRELDSRQTILKKKDTIE